MTVDADAYNARELADGVIVPSHVSAMTALWQDQHGLGIDGKCGPNTRRSILAEEPGLLTPAMRPIPPGDPPDQVDEWTFGQFEGPLERIPRTRTDVYSIFGDPGTRVRPDRRWRKKNIIEVRDLPGVPYKWYFKCHRLAEPYIREGLRRAGSVSDYAIERAGGFVLRHIQHNSAKPLSLHSWGIALDIDPRRNASKRFKRGECPVPWSKEWKRLWPDGMDRAFVEAMESVGFTWGGMWGESGGDWVSRANRVSYCDGMHFELRIRA